jgi:aminobenzoyl-glutamate utilization protein B
MSIGRNEMEHTSKALAMTMVDLFENPELIKKVKAEFHERKGD